MILAIGMFLTDAITAFSVLLYYGLNPETTNRAPFAAMIGVTVFTLLLCIPLYIWNINNLKTGSKRTRAIIGIVFSAITSLEALGLTIYCFYIMMTAVGLTFI